MDEACGNNPRARCVARCWTRPLWFKRSDWAPHLDKFWGPFDHPNLDFYGARKNFTEKRHGQKLFLRVLVLAKLSFPLRNIKKNLFTWFLGLLNMPLKKVSLKCWGWAKYCDRHAIRWCTWTITIKKFTRSLHGSTVSFNHTHIGQSSFIQAYNIGTSEHVR